MLTHHQQQHYDAFYESTHHNEFLDERTELLVGLAAAMAMDCGPCTAYYLKRARDAQLSRGEIAEVVAKVMAVAAGQKRLQAMEVIKSNGIDLDAWR